MKLFKYDYILKNKIYNNKNNMKLIDYINNPIDFGEKLNILQKNI